MSREYPDWISSERAAEGKRVFAGTIPFARMKRLSALLADGQGGEASFVAKFKRDLDKRVVIDLQVNAALPLLCQVSLEVYDEYVNRHSELAVVENDSELDELPESYDAVVADNGRLAFAGLVEDEILLDVPYFPKKPGARKIEFSEGEAGFSDGVNTPGEDKQRPFAALQEMLERDKEN